MSLATNWSTCSHMHVSPNYFLLVLLLDNLYCMNDYTSLQTIICQLLGDGISIANLTHYWGRSMYSKTFLYM